MLPHYLVKAGRHCQFEISEVRAKVQPEESLMELGPIYCPPPPAQIGL